MQQRFAIAPRLGAVLAGAALAAGALIGPGHAPVASAQYASAPTVRQASGATAADIQASVDAFRADLGGANNAANAPVADGRREINWDGVPDARSAPNNLPAGCRLRLAGAWLPGERQRWRGTGALRHPQPGV